MASRSFIFFAFDALSALSASRRMLRSTSIQRSRKKTIGEFWSSRNSISASLTGSPSTRTVSFAATGASGADSASGETSAAALGVYGTVSGMVFPVLGFASVFFNALAEMLIPEMTAAQLQSDLPGLRRSVQRLLSACLLFSGLVSALLFLLGPALGRLLYRSAEAGRYIRALAPLVLVMYLDTVVDGMLKGLGLQLDSMLINLADACLALLAVRTLLPRFGIAAYIAILYGSECFNFLLSFLRLRRFLRIKLL